MADETPPAEGANKGKPRRRRPTKDERIAQLQRRVDELDGLYRISQAFSAVTDVQEVYSQLTTQVAELMKVEKCAILLYDEAQRELVCQAPAYGLTDEQARSYRIPLTEDSLAWSLWRENWFFASNDVPNDPLVTSLGLGDFARQMGVTRTLLVIMRVGNQPIGVIQPSNKLDGADFVEEDARLLSIFATQAAMVIENARLYERERRRAREMALLNEIEQAVGANLDLEPTLRAILTSTRSLLDYTMAEVNLWDEARQMLVTKEVIGWEHYPEEEQYYRLDEGYTGWIAAHQSPLLVDDTHEYEAVVPKFPDRVPWRSFVGVPIMLGEKLIGSLELMNETVAAYDEADVDVLVRVAARAATAIERAQFFAHVNQLNSDLLATQKRLMEMVRELSTPIIPVTDDILVLPLIGSIDSDRAARIMEELLVGITRHQAELVIIDITGVPVVDTGVANHLLQTAKAAALLGARCILTGIRSEVAQTIVHLGVDLSEVTTCSNLQAGIEHALSLVGLEISPRREEAGRSS